MKRFKIIFTFLISIIIAVNGMLCLPFTALALNRDYLKTEKWFSSGSITAEPVRNRSGNSQIEGEFRYYIDSESFSIYTYFNLIGNNLDGESEKPRIIYTLKTQTEQYDLEFDENGLLEELYPEEARIFETGATFDLNSNTYIAAAQLRTKDEIGELSVRFFDGARSYIIKEHLLIDRRPEETETETATKTSTTKPAAKTEGTKKTTTKATKANSSQKKSTTKTYKFAGSRQYTLSSSSEETLYEPTGYDPEEEAQDEDAYLYDKIPTEGQSVLSDSAKRYLYAAAACGGLGILFLLLAALSKNKKE